MTTKLIVRINSRSHMLPPIEGVNVLQPLTEELLEKFKVNPYLFSRVREYFEEIFGLRFYIVQALKDGELRPKFVAPETEEEVQLRPGADRVISLLTTLASSNTEAPAILLYPEDGLAPDKILSLTEFFLKTIFQQQQKWIVETTSELITLRIRRSIAEGKISADDVDLFFEGEKVQISREGDLDKWPTDLFSEAYEEVCALQKAARERTE